MIRQQTQILCPWGSPSESQGTRWLSCLPSASFQTQQEVPACCGGAGGEEQFLFTFSFSGFNVIPGVYQMSLKHVRTSLFFLFLVSKIVSAYFSHSLIQKLAKLPLGQKKKKKRVTSPPLPNHPHLLLSFQSQGIASCLLQAFWDNPVVPTSRLYIVLIKYLQMAQQ